MRFLKIGRVFFRMLFYGKRLFMARGIYKKNGKGRMDVFEGRNAAKIKMTKGEREV